MNSNLIEVKKQISILNLLSERYQINLDHKGAGRYTCLCPLHKSDSVPSFNVYVKDENNHLEDSWYCFGCGKGGDVIEFVMEFEQRPFNQALKILQQMIGVTEEKLDRLTILWQRLLNQKPKIKNEGEEIIILKYDLGIRLREYLKKSKGSEAYERRCKKVDKIFKVMDEIFIIERAEEAKKLYTNITVRLRSR